MTRYFEKTSPSDYDFIEIDIDNESYSVRQGVIGEAGQEKIHTYDSSQQAMEGARELIATLKKQGAREVFKLESINKTRLENVMNKIKKELRSAVDEFGPELPSSNLSLGDYEESVDNVWVMYIQDGVVDLLEEFSLAEADGDEVLNDLREFFEKAFKAYADANGVSIQTRPAG